MRQVIAANWKMHGDFSWAAKPAELAELLDADTIDKVDLVICPPMHLLAAMEAMVEDAPVTFGAQNCHAETSGAYTGEVSAQMVAETGAAYVILGHSERRQYSAETDAQVNAKAIAAHAAGLITIICVGESLDMREAGRADDIVAAQIKGSLPDCVTGMNTIVAYEPIWAIGTGKVPSLDDIARMHAGIRARLTERFGESTADGIAIQYGGSVKPANAADILAIPNVDGALIGGASLEMDSFAAIAKAARDYDGL